jgi:hypothetical protein
MEQEMEMLLSYPIDDWTPWAADEEMLYGIMTGQLMPPLEVKPAMSDEWKPQRKAYPAFRKAA